MLLAKLLYPFKLIDKCGKPACFQLASLLASGRRPISAVVLADLCSICEKINRLCGIERLIASFKSNRRSTHMVLLGMLMICTN